MKTFLQCSPLRLSALIALAAGASSCLDNSITGVREMSMVLTASASSVVVGDSVTFNFEAEGTGLFGAIVAYDDGAADSLRFSGGFDPIDWGDVYGAAPTDTVFFRGPVAAGATLLHAFAAPGTFAVVGEVIGAGGVAVDTVVVTVN
jgi:hypothetical protein